MYRVRSLLLGATVASLAASAFAADGPTVLLPPDSTAMLKLSGTAGESATITNAPVSGQPFKTVLRIEVAKKPERPNDVQISIPIDGTMAAGDVLMVSFYMRSAGSGQATLDAGFRTVPGALPQGRGSRGQVPPGEPPATALDGEIPRGYPPVFVLSGTRDMCLSQSVLLHRKLRNAGVDTDLNVFEGMWHFFWEDPSLPESREAMTALASFFNRHLQ